MSVLLDSNIWIAFLYKKDPNHKRAEEIFEGIKERVVLTEYLFLEIVSVISKKVGKKVADDFIKNVIDNRDIEIFPSSQEFLGEIIKFYLSKKIEKLSFVDYSLLYLAQKMKVITFDETLKRELKKLS